MKNTFFVTICTIAFLTVKAYAAEQIVPPNGWRFPTQKELSDKERSGSSTKFAVASADFNGDGIDDQAFIFKSTKFSGQGLLVRLSDTKSGYRWITLDQINWGPKYPDVNLDMGLETLPPGTHEYLCVVTGNDCIRPEKDRLKMKTKTASILYYRFGSAASMFFWDTKSKNFVKAWLSI
jgi:hypothetical protein